MENQRPLLQQSGSTYPQCSVLNIPYWIIRAFIDFNIGMYNIRQGCGCPAITHISHRQLRFQSIRNVGAKEPDKRSKECEAESCDLER